ncbi:hypothetical protein EV368DRAFT_87328 [Lentinula lateritia]|uniref:Uncharacterized protein n=1 Tax=Lentinula aff. lateritia TaxID=2804960 RepID=A0ACC1TNC9_9AGAR|nr:hypothetical protein F5876DRAFT_81043 [Lentinula aff. lateritia]KAJ3847787.1 hypothetical protein EV368DRAFT_87328 [Lentinula lateritia]
MKLKALGIECWLSSSDTDEHHTYDTETSYNETCRTTTVKTSVSAEPDYGSEINYYVSWRTSPNEPMSLWCMVLSKKPTGQKEIIESKTWMCSSKKNTQQRSSKYFHENTVKRFRPHSIKTSDRMGTLKLEIKRLKGTVKAVCLDGEYDLDFDMLDEEHPWLVFEFNFKRKDDKEVSAFSNSMTHIYSQKRKREISVSPSASTSSSLFGQHSVIDIAPHENTLSSSEITLRAVAGPSAQRRRTSTNLHSHHSVPALIADRSPHALITSSIVDLPASRGSNVTVLLSRKAKEPNYTPHACSEPNQVKAMDDAQADSHILDPGQKKASGFSQNVASSLASPIEVIEREAEGLEKKSKELAAKIVAKKQKKRRKGAEAKIAKLKAQIQKQEAELGSFSTDSESEGV